MLLIQMLFSPWLLLKDQPKRKYPNGRVQKGDKHIFHIQHHGITSKKGATLTMFQTLAAVCNCKWASNWTIVFAHSPCILCRLLSSVVLFIQMLLFQMMLFRILFIFLMAEHTGGGDVVLHEKTPPNLNHQPSFIQPCRRGGWVSGAAGCIHMVCTPPR